MQIYIYIYVVEISLCNAIECLFPCQIVVCQCNTLVTFSKKSVQVTCSVRLCDSVTKVVSKIIIGLPVK